MRLLAIQNPFNAPVYHEETVSSTMDIARLLAAQGEKHGAVITADFQEAGRGRVRERPWNMERGNNLPFTILLRYGRIEAIPAAITLRSGLALAHAIEDFVPALSGRVMIKWPNDIMIGSKKAAGILAEAEGGNVFTGIGINVAQQEFPPALRDKAVSLGSAAGIAIAPETRFTLLETILARLYRELAASDWRGRLLERLYKKGEQVCFIDGGAGSNRAIEGRLEGIGPGGELLITPNGENCARAFVTGELRVY
ncbi:MAG: biotin--[acetyl-CoA-carboxylase] ligase [Treponema sp.]|jgi:BirA family biotin operon repressor/biotin-[acetyl-CoA-carboxylase] ligase|nr:biotin--[acetyl-CoA-carboxylase] ligase [Treponema sp.]